MRDTRKPFVLTRHNRFLFNIAPRNLSGWLQMGVWMALLAPIVYGFHRYTESTPGGPDALALALFLLANVVWVAGGVWWMWQRAEVIDVQALLREQHDAERKRRR